VDKATKVTFNEPVQVPGKVLPAGTYVFRLQDSTSNRHIVQIFNEDHTSLITTVLAIPNYRLQPTGKTVLTYDERPADQPMALAAWFYPGDSSGQEFAYPKSEAEQLSRRNKREVPSTGSEEAYPADLQQRSTQTASGIACLIEDLRTWCQQSCRYQVLGRHRGGDASDAAVFVMPNSSRLHVCCEQTWR